MYYYHKDNLGAGMYKRSNWQLCVTFHFHFLGKLCSNEIKFHQHLELTNNPYEMKTSEIEGFWRNWRNSPFFLNIRNNMSYYLPGFKVRIHGQGESAALMSNVGLLVSAGSRTTMALKHEKVRLSLFVLVTTKINFYWIRKCLEKLWTCCLSKFICIHKKVLLREIARGVPLTA